MRKLNRLLCLMLIIAVAALISIGGCSRSDVLETRVAPEKQSSAEMPEVKLTGYLIGEAPAGMPDVMAKLNEKLKKDINAVLEINHIRWTDLQSKYPLVLASSDNIDLIFAANWSFYGQEASKGAFREITPELLQTYMPRYYKHIKDTKALKEARINGKVYMIPAPSPDRKISVTLIREDLRKKYDLPEIRKFSDIEPYLQAIKENEPDMIPLNIDPSIDIGRCLYNIAFDNGTYWQDLFKTTTGGSGLYYDIEDASGRLCYVYEGVVAENFKAAAKKVKSWYDKGYINKNAFANKVRSKDSFAQGKSAVGFGNSVDIQDNISKAEQHGWEVGIIPQLDIKGHYPEDAYTNNGVAIVARSKNPERAMMALDLIMMDEAYNNLVYFGIQGKNYFIKDGKIDVSEDLIKGKNSYPPDGAGFWFTNKEQHKPMASWNDSYLGLRNNLKGMLVKDIYGAFSPNTEKVKTEVGNVNQTIVQYYNPICLGMVKDVDTAFETLKEKLKAAGIERLKNEMDKQTREYIEQQK